jgi:esterase
VNSVELSYETFGKPNNCPIIILHGFLASSRNWRSIAKRLAERHYIYAVDMRNHGASPHADNMDYPLMAHDIAHFMDNISLRKAHLMGHSMGGKIAMWFALHYPERIEKLMVVDIAPVSYDHSFDPIIHALKKIPLEKLNNRKHAESFLVDTIPDMGFRQFLLQNLLLKDGQYFWRINLDIIQKAAHHIVSFPDVSAKRYSRKALFIAGEYSKYIQPEMVYQQFPEATIVEISGTGHWLYVEAPDEFCNAIHQWVHSG